MSRRRHLVEVSGHRLPGLRPEIGKAHQTLKWHHYRGSGLRYRPVRPPRRDPGAGNQLWRGAMRGAMRPPWSIGFKMPRNRHPGRRLTGACNKRADVRGSGIPRRRSAGSRSPSRALLNLHGRQRTHGWLPPACPPERRGLTRRTGSKHSAESRVPSLKPGPRFLSSPGSWDHRRAPSFYRLPTSGPRRPLSTRAFAASSVPSLQAPWASNVTGTQMWSGRRAGKSISSAGHAEARADRCVTGAVTLYVALAAGR
jgi:hypothetical protein